MRLRSLDFVAILAAAAAIAVASAAAYSGGGGARRAIVTGRSGEWIYPLDADRTIEVAGPLGSSRLEIHDKSIHFADSPCPNKTCVAAGNISTAGQWLACLPNEVFVRIEGGANDAGGIDAGAY
jgi:hypothetical protein